MNPRYSNHWDQLFYVNIFSFLYCIGSSFLMQLLWTKINTNMFPCMVPKCKRTFSLGVIAGLFLAIKI